MSTRETIAEQRELAALRAGSEHHEHVGTLHFANGWPMQLCSSCLEQIDHRVCLECRDAKREGRQISEGERRNAWGK